MPLVTSEKMLSDAQKGGYAVGAFNVENMEMMQAVIAAAEAWLQAHPSGLQPRFDVIEVYGEEGAPVPPRINHLENAFGG